MKSQFTKVRTPSHPYARRSERWSALQLVAKIASPSGCLETKDDSKHELRERDNRSTFTRLDSLLLDLP